ncbi:acylphosphatase [Thioploca ingrica]|uniref:acylphosphatase n=1 Tax=Thioploca ingrica TaxID=40754 RepID=A0A090AAH9_9GAMM|nr:acylphosphatase [Thioploca ingrica]
MEQKICQRCLVSGRVQGVSFRYYTRQQAQRLGVSGWAYNLANGRVEVVACGDSRAVEQLCAWLHQGPPLAYVISVQCQAITRPHDCSDGFEIG